MNDFPSNSHAARKATVEPSAIPAPDSQKIILEPVVTGKVTRRKKPLLSRVTETLFRGKSSVLGYLLEEVLVPALKDMATSMVTQGIQKALYPEGPPRGTTHGYSPAARGHVNYSRVGGLRSAGPSVGPPRIGEQRSALKVDDVIVETKIEAQRIIDNLYSIVAQYGAATVGHLNDLIRQTSHHTDHNYGWTNLDELTATRVSGGYLLLLPPVEVLR